LEVNTWICFTGRVLTVQAGIVLVALPGFFV